MRLLPRRGFGPVLEVVAGGFLTTCLIAVVALTPRQAFGRELLLETLFLILLTLLYFRKYAREALTAWRRLDAPRRPGQTALQTVTDGEEG